MITSPLLVIILLIGTIQNVNASIFPPSLVSEALKSWGCENNVLVIVCPANSQIIVSSAFYGSLDQVGCTFGGSEAYSCSTDATTVVQAECNYKSSCSVLANNGVFGDPCYGTYKYLEASYSCIPYEPRDSSTEIITTPVVIDTSEQTTVTTVPNVESGVLKSWGCENNALIITCPAYSQIIVISAFYGSLEQVRCTFGGSEAYSCSTDATEVVKVECNYKSSCSIPANNGVFGDPCYGTYKYLEASYSCIPKSDK